MPTTKNSPDPSGYRSRFKHSPEVFPLRQYLRCRDEFVHRMILTAVLVFFVVLQLVFARTLLRLFARHGENVAAWIEWLSLGVVFIAVGFTIRRIVRNIKESRELRTEMAIWKKASEAGLDDG